MAAEGFPIADNKQALHKYVTLGKVSSSTLQDRSQQP